MIGTVTVYGTREGACARVHVRRQVGEQRRLLCRRGGVVDLEGAFRQDDLGGAVIAHSERAGIAERPRHDHLARLVRRRMGAAASPATAIAPTARTQRPKVRSAPRVGITTAPFSSCA
jgi:hypothetical protein